MIVLASQVYDVVDRLCLRVWVLQGSGLQCLLQDQWLSRSVHKLCIHR